MSALKQQPINLLPKPAEAFERVLQLAARERQLRDSPQWKTDLEAALDAHSEAVEALYNEFYRCLDVRTSSGDPVPKLALPPDPRKELQKQIVARLKQALPDMVAEIISEF